MPRPYRPRNRPSPDASVMQGGPGQEGEWDNELILSDDTDDEDEHQETRPSPSASDPMAAINSRLAALEAENERLRRSIPPPAPVSHQPQSDPFDEVDWETELYRDPKETLRRYGEIVEQRVERRLTAKYQQERGQSKFWEDFYRENKDLKKDHDLVQATLQSNMSALANIPVPEAMEKLADLTRERIMRYSGKTSGRKARIEGNDPPQPRPQPREERTVVTLGDIIRNRREARRKGQAA